MEESLNTKTVTNALSNTSKLVKFLMPSSFALAIGCFFMIFCTVRCGNTPIATVTGMSMVTGGEVKSPAMKEMKDMVNSFGGKADKPTKTKDDKKEKIKPQPFAIIAFACGILGIILTFAWKKNHYKPETILALIGVVSMAALMITFPFGESKGGGSKNEFLFHWEPGYWISFVGFVIALLLGIVHLLQPKAQPLPYQDSTSEIPTEE